MTEPCAWCGNECDEWDLQQVVEHAGSPPVNVCRDCLLDDYDDTIDIDDEKPFH